MKIEIPTQGKVLAAYGADAQAMVHCEELAELIQAVSKMRRVRNSQPDDSLIDDNDEYYNLVEEMADVLVCLEQMQEMYGIADHEIQGMIFEKCTRQEERIHGHV